MPGHVGHPVIALWTVPRSASTAFERMMMERGDVAVLHEPFSLHYYYGPQKRSTRYDEVRPEGDVDRILARIDAIAADRPVFVKDMAYHVDALLDRTFAARFVNTFLVRDPAWTLPSLAAQWPDFTDEEAGFEALDRFVDLVSSSGARPVVIDSDDLRRDPVGVVEGYCRRVGLPFRPDALSWAPGMPAEWGLWEEWHRETAETAGWLPPPVGAPPALPSPLAAAAYERCRPVYARLRALAWASPLTR
jgi:Sulfotransferase domain